MSELPTKDIMKKEGVIKERIGYGVKLPALTFGEAIEIVKTVATTGGIKGHKDALSHVTGNTPTSSTLHYKVAALKNFGLLTIQDDSYELTALGERIAQPQSSEDVDQAIFESFLKLDILKDTWENYRGKLLPQREYLANFIEKYLGIPQSLKLGWADYFISSAKYACLLKEREAGSGSYQVLNQPLPRGLRVVVSDDVNGDDIVLIEPTQESKSTLSDSLGIESQHWGILNKRKISNNRKAIFAIPDELTQQDIDSLKLVLKGIEAMLDGLKKQEEN